MADPFFLVFMRGFRLTFQAGGPAFYFLTTGFYPPKGKLFKNIFRKLHKTGQLFAGSPPIDEKTLVFTAK